MQHSKTDVLSLMNPLHQLCELFNQN